MVGSHQALFLITPLKEWEVDYPQTYEVVLITKPQTIAHLQTERTELDTRLIGIVARKDQHEVAILGTCCFLNLCPDLRRIELIDAGLNCTILIELDIYQALGTYLRTLDELGQFIELLTGIVGTTRYTDTTDIVSIIEYRESSSTLQLIHQLDELHAETKIGLI